MQRDANTGFTLIEIIMTIVVLAAGLLGIVSIYIQTVVRSADPMLNLQALALAEGYLEEILGTRCTEGPEPAANRDFRDRVLQYNGLDDHPPTDIAGNALAGLEHYRVQVVVTHTALGPEHQPLDGCRVQVSVTSQRDNSLQTELIGYMARRDDAD